MPAFNCGIDEDTSFGDRDCLCCSTGKVRLSWGTTWLWFNCSDSSSVIEMLLLIRIYCRRSSCGCVWFLDWDAFDSLVLVFLCCWFSGDTVLSLYAPSCGVGSSKSTWRSSFLLDRPDRTVDVTWLEDGLRLPLLESKLLLFLMNLVLIGVLWALLICNESRIFLMLETLYLSVVTFES